MSCENIFSIVLRKILKHVDWLRPFLDREFLHWTKPDLHRAITVNVIKNCSTSESLVSIGQIFLTLFLLLQSNIPTWEVEKQPANKLHNEKCTGEVMGIKEPFLRNFNLFFLVNLNGNFKQLVKKNVKKLPKVDPKHQMTYISIILGSALRISFKLCTITRYNERTKVACLQFPEKFCYRENG